MQSLGCFIFDYLNLRCGPGPVQEGFARKYRDAFHVYKGNGTMTFAFSSEHHEFANMAFGARHEERRLAYSDVLLRFYERQLFAQLRGDVIGKLDWSYAVANGLFKDGARNLCHSLI